MKWNHGNPPAIDHIVVSLASFSNVSMPSDYNKKEAMQEQKKVKQTRDTKIGNRDWLEIGRIQAENLKCSPTLVAL